MTNTKHVAQLKEALRGIRSVAGAVPASEVLLLQAESLIEEVLMDLVDALNPARRPVVETAVNTAADHVVRVARASSRSFMDLLLTLESSDDETVASLVERSVNDISRTLWVLDEQLHAAARVLTRSGIEKVPSYNSWLVERAMTCRPVLGVEP